MTYPPPLLYASVLFPIKKKIIINYRVSLSLLDIYRTIALNTPCNKTFDPIYINLFDREVKGLRL